MICESLNLTYVLTWLGFYPWDRNTGKVAVPVQIWVLRPTMIILLPMYFLKVFYLVLLLGVISLIVVLHVIPAPFLNFLRIPKLLLQVDTYRYLRYSYAVSFQAYHSVLYFLLGSMAINLASLTLVNSPLLAAFSTVFSLAGLLLSSTLAATFSLICVRGHRDSLIRKGCMIYAVFFVIVFMAFFSVLLIHEETLQNMYGFISSVRAGE